MSANTPEISPERIERLKQRLLESVTRPLTVVRARQAAPWTTLLPGVDVRVLHRDPQRRLQVALWRLAPGAVLPAHPHHADEECYLIDGDLGHRDERYDAGDFMIAHGGTRHAEICSQGGALMLIRGDLVDAI